MGEVADKLCELFARVSEANSTSGDPKRRAGYLVLLERQHAGPPTGMEVILKTEAAFKEALKSDPSVSQYHLALAHVVLRGRGASEVAESHEILDKPLGLNPEHQAAKLMMANVLEQEGEPKAALKLIDEVLAADPAHAEANREHRAVRERMKQGAQSKALLGKLLKR